MSEDDTAAAWVLDLMDFGRSAVRPRRADVATEAYGHLFHARFGEALRVAQGGSVPAGYPRAVARQVEALCTGAVTEDLGGTAVDPGTLTGAMTVFALSEAAQLVGHADDCAGLLGEALSRPNVPARARTWLGMALTRNRIFAGDVDAAAVLLDDVERWAATRVSRQSVRCLRAMVCGLRGDSGTAVAVAAELRSGIVDPSTYADAGLALLGAIGLAVAGLPQAGSNLLSYGAGGPGLPLLPSALRAFGYDVLLEAAVAAGDVELADWMMLDVDRLDFNGNGQLVSARETARARVRIAGGAVAEGAARASSATQDAMSLGIGLIAARAAITGLRAEQDRAGRPSATPACDDRAVALLAQVTSADLRRWMDQLLLTSPRPAQAQRDSAWAQLTPAQQVVARLAASGLRNQEIADVLVVSLRTVEAHISAILDSLGVTNRVGIVGYDARAGEVDTALLERATPRQRDVALLLVGGRTNAEIAVELGITDKTVEHHVRGLFRSLGVTSRSAVVARLLHR